MAIKLTVRLGRLGRRAVLGLGAALALGAIARAQTAPLTIATDLRIALSQPDRAALDAWVETLKARIAIWRPIQTTTLSSPDFTPTTTVELRFIYIRPERIPAKISGSVIMIEPGDLLPGIHNPDTLSMIGHELVHVAQRHPGGQRAG